MNTVTEQKHMTHEVFESMKKVRDELDDIMETLELMNDSDLMNSIEQGKKDLMEGKSKKFKDKEDVNNYFEMLKK